MKRSYLLLAGFLALTSSMHEAYASPSSKLHDAFVALTETNWEVAERELTKLTASGKDRATAWFGLAQTRLATGRYDEAAKDAARAASLDKRLRFDALPLQAEALRRQGKVHEAIALLTPWKDQPSARRLRLVLGDLHLEMGRVEEARELLLTLIDDYNDGSIAKSDAEGLALVGRAAHLLRSARDANDAYAESEKAGRRVETLLWRAELFLEKYDPGHAEEVVNEALDLAPNHPEALVLLAKVKLDQTLDFGAAERAVAKALAINPKLAGAYFVRAGIALRDMDLDEADRACDAGLSANPGNLELLSMKAAVRFLADDREGYERIRKEVFAKNPKFAAFYRIVGEFAEWEHRYDEIVAMMKEATNVDPRDGKAWADMGLNLIRAGDEEGGLEALRKAFRFDKFNVRVFNTLNLYEKKIANDYVTVSHGPFRIRYAKSEQAVLSRYVPAMVDEAWASMTERYGYVPKSPLSIELYESNEHFSVRTSGLPNVGIQGVCFGKTLAAMSPSAQPFNWGNVLWHELAHVFAIHLSDYRVPRWFTEGLSEYETIVRRPEWQREEDPALYLALTKNRLPSIEQLNRAFTRAENGRDITTAYYAASQVQLWLIETYGLSKSVEMLKLWGQGLRTPQVIERALGITPSELDARFRAWLRKRLVRYDHQFVPDLRAPSLADAEAAAKASANHPRPHVEHALALIEKRRIDEAHRALDRALDILPIDPEAKYLRARLHWAEGDAERARAELVDLVRQGSDGYATRMLLAEIDLRAKKLEAARYHLSLAHEFDPTMSPPVRMLHELEREAGREAEALALLGEAARLDQHDRELWVSLLEGLVEAGQWEKARKVGESAIFVDVNNPEVHVLYARALSQGRQHEKAIFELESALACKPNRKDEARVHALLAKEHLAVGNRTKAEAARARARELDPGSVEGESTERR